MDCIVATRMTASIQQPSRLLRRSFVVLVLVLAVEQICAFSVPTVSCTDVSHCATGPSPRSRTTSTTSTALSATRRDVVFKTLLLPLVATTSIPTIATAKADDTAASINPFDAVRRELTDSQGGVAYMNYCIEKQDFESLLEFTKEYDQVLRKKAMVKAKKLLPKEYQEQATSYCNAVTFDLIGINRNSRKGQENKDEAYRYLVELVKDAQSLLELESKVVPE